MRKNEPKNQYLFDFDEQGAQEVSDQIMNAYNSGCIDDVSDSTEGNPSLGESKV